MKTRVFVKEEQEKFARGRSASPSARITVMWRLDGRKSAGGVVGQPEKGGGAELEERKTRWEPKRGRNEELDGKR